MARDDLGYRSEGDFVARSGTQANALAYMLEGYAELAGKARDDTTLEDLRRIDDAAWARFDRADARVEAVDAGGVPSLLVRAPGARGAATVVWFHGGGYMIGSAAGRRGLGAELSELTRGPVLLPDYRLAPEHPFPAAVDDALAAWAWLTGSSAPSSVVLGGESAGGTLALATALAARDRGYPAAAGVIAVSPVVDWSLRGEYLVARAAADRVLDLDALHRARSAFLPDGDPLDPLVSPLHAELGGLPPVLVQVGSSEILFDDARRFTEAGAQAGVDVTLQVYDDMFHLWHLLSSVLPAAADTLRAQAAFVQGCTAVSAARPFA